MTASRGLEHRDRERQGDAYAIVTCVARRPGLRARFGMVVNRVTSIDVARAALEKLQEVARRFLGLPLHELGAIHEEPAVTPRRLGQPPLVVSHPECRTSAEIRQLLSRLDAMTGGIRLARHPPHGTGITARMMAQLPRPA